MRANPLQGFGRISLRLKGASRPLLGNQAPKVWIPCQPEADPSLGGCVRYEKGIPMIKDKTLCNSILFIIVLLLHYWRVAPVDAQSGKDFFEGKTIPLLAGSTAGGGTDLTARLIAR